MRKSVPEVGCMNAPRWVNAILLEDEYLLEFRVACGIYCMLERDGLWPTRTALYRRIQNSLPDGQVSLTDALSRINEDVHAVFTIRDRKPGGRGPVATRIGFSPYIARHGFIATIDSAAWWPGRTLTDDEKNKIDTTSANNRVQLDWLHDLAREFMSEVPSPTRHVERAMPYVEMSYVDALRQRSGPMRDTLGAATVQSLGSLPRDDDAEIAAAHAEADTKFDSPDPDPEPDPTYEEPPF